MNGPHSLTHYKQLVFVFLTFPYLSVPVSLVTLST